MKTDIKKLNIVNYIKVIFVIMTSFLICSCQAPTAKQKIKLSPSNMESILKRGITTREKVIAMLGEPVRKESTRNQEVWIYEWLEQEQRTVSPGIELAELGSHNRSFPGYKHFLTSKMIVTLIFGNNGKLINFQYLKQ